MCVQFPLTTASRARYQGRDGCGVDGDGGMTGVGALGSSSFPLKNSSCTTMEKGWIVEDSMGAFDW